MNLKFSLAMLALFAVFGVAFGIFHPVDVSKLKILGVNNSRSSDKTLTAKFYAAKEFQEGIINAQSSESKYSGNKIYGGIIPHHLLPGYILSDFFEKLSKQNPKRIILIGPNHHELGGTRPITSSANWQTEFGVLNSDYSSITELIQSDTLVENDDVSLGEHSIGGILHYIKYYIPDAKVIPIILSSTTSDEDMSKLVDSLQKYIDDDTVVISSVDFSHYLSREEAERSDVITKRIMSDFDYDNLRRLNNDYVDSPPSIALQLHLMQNEGAKNEEILFNTNSGVILKDDSIKTTSYFSIFFTK